MNCRLYVGLGALLFITIVAAESKVRKEGPQVIGKPGNQIIIAGDNAGPFYVKGVGTFANKNGEHLLIDERGNTFHHKTVERPIAESSTKTSRTTTRPKTKERLTWLTHEKTGKRYYVQTDGTMLTEEQYTSSAVTRSKSQHQTPRADWFVNEMTRKRYYVQTDGTIITEEEYSSNDSTSETRSNRRKREAQNEDDITVTRPGHKVEIKGSKILVSRDRRRRSPEPNPDMSVVMSNPHGQVTAQISDQRRRRSPEPNPDMSVVMNNEHGHVIAQESVRRRCGREAQNEDDITVTHPGHRVEIKGSKILVSRERRRRSPEPNPNLGVVMSNPHGQVTAQVSDQRRRRSPEPNPDFSVVMSNSHGQVTAQESARRRCGREAQNEDDITVTHPGHRVEIKGSKILVSRERRRRSPEPNPNLGVVMSNPHGQVTAQISDQRRRRSPEPNPDMSVVMNNEHGHVIAQESVRRRCGREAQNEDDITVTHPGHRVEIKGSKILVSRERRRRSPEPNPNLGVVMSNPHGQVTAQISDQRRRRSPEPNPDMSVVMNNEHGHVIAQESVRRRCGREAQNEDDITVTHPGHRVEIKGSKILVSRERRRRSPEPNPNLGVVMNNPQGHVIAQL